MFTTHKTTRRFGLIFKFMLEFLVDILWKRFFGGVDEEPDEVWSVTGDDGVDEEPDEVWSVTGDDGVDEEQDEVWS